MKIEHSKEKEIKTTYYKFTPEEVLEILADYLDSQQLPLAENTTIDLYPKMLLIKSSSNPKSIEEKLLDSIFGVPR